MQFIKLFVLLNQRFISVSPFNDAILNLPFLWPLLVLFTGVGAVGIGGRFITIRPPEEIVETSPKRGGNLE